MVQTKEKIGICVALIHNNNIERNRYLRPRLVELTNNIQKHFEVTQIEISKQPQVIPHSMPMAIFRSFIYEKLDRKWCRYRRIKPRNIFLVVLHFIAENIRKYIFKRDLGALWNRYSFIETILTDKHIQAWNTFIETGCDYLVCFEDDTVFMDDSIHRMCNLLDALSKNRVENLVYVDLAGGYDIVDLQISFLETHRGNGFRYYLKPVTNTACTYLLNKPLVSEFLTYLVRRPRLRLISADWMMNTLFMLISKSTVECLCMHADPTIFKHGSAIGAYESFLMSF